MGVSIWDGELSFVSKLGRGVVMGQTEEKEESDGED